MKRFAAILLTFVLFVSVLPVQAIADAYCSHCNQYLSPANRCPSHPTVYANARRKTLYDGKLTDVRGVKAATVVNTFGRSEYGVYLKFTPSRSDNGFYIYSIDIVVSNSKGYIVQQTHYDTDITEYANSMWYWDFYSLNDAYVNTRERFGSIKGVYTLDIYFNGQWVGKVNTKLF